MSDSDKVRSVVSSRVTPTPTPLRHVDHRKHMSAAVTMSGDKVIKKTITSRTGARSVSTLSGTHILNVINNKEVKNIKVTGFSYGRSNGNTLYTVGLSKTQNGELTTVLSEPKLLKDLHLFITGKEVADGDKFLLCKVTTEDETCKPDNMSIAVVCTSIHKQVIKKE